MKSLTEDQLREIITKAYIKGCTDAADVLYYEPMHNFNAEAKADKFDQFANELIRSV